MLPAIERAGLLVTDIEILRLHYAETLKAWRERFLAHREEVERIYDQRFVRMWEFYLAASEMSFREQNMMVFQIQLTKRQGVVPMTRDYIAREEQRLRAAEGSQRHAAAARRRVAPPKPSRRAAQAVKTNPALSAANSPDVNSVWIACAMARFAPVVRKCACYATISKVSTRHPWHRSIRPLASRSKNLPRLYRSAPHNIEAEQALLGAILVNNEAFYRVSDFLEPEHFFEPIHQKIYQLARDLIRAGKIATPVTLKTFLDADIDIGGMTLEPISRPARRRSHHHHQCRGLRPHHLRPADPPRADHRRRGHGQCRLRRAGRFLAAQPDRGRRAQALRTGRDRPLRRRLPALRAGADHRDRHGGARLSSATASCPASPPGSTISTA